MAELDILCDKYGELQDAMVTMIKDLSVYQGNYYNPDGKLQSAMFLIETVIPSKHILASEELIEIAREIADNVDGRSWAYVKGTAMAKKLRTWVKKYQQIGV